MDLATVGLLLGGALASGSTGPWGLPAALGQAPAVPVGKRYPFKKSMNLWAFPYPQQMTLEQCCGLAKRPGSTGIELNYDLDSELSPKSGTAEFTAIRKLADKIGIAISGMCSFLFWLIVTAHDPARAARGLELAGKIVESSL